MNTFRSSISVPFVYFLMFPGYPYFWVRIDSSPGCMRTIVNLNKNFSTVVFNRCAIPPLKEFDELGGGISA